VERQLQLQNLRLAEIGCGDRQQRDRPLARVVGQHPAHKRNGHVGQRRGGADRRRQGQRPRDRAKVGKANANGHRPAGTVLGAEAARDAVCEVLKDGAEHGLVGRLAPQGRLRASRVGASPGLDGARIAVPGERRQLAAGGAAQ
jgi:hypothetical protein